MARKNEKRNENPLDIPQHLLDARTARLDDPEGIAKYPSLYGILVPRYDADRMTYGGARLSMYVEGAIWVVRIDSDQLGVAATFHVPFLCEALTMVDKMIAANQVIWVPSYRRKKKLLTALDKVLQ